MARVASPQSPLLRVQGIQSLVRHINKEQHKQSFNFSKALYSTINLAQDIIAVLQFT